MDMAMTANGQQLCNEKKLSMIVFGWTGLYNGIRTKALEHQ